MPCWPLNAASRLPQLLLRLRRSCNNNGLTRNSLGSFIRFGTCVDKITKSLKAEPSTFIMPTMSAPFKSLILVMYAILKPCGRPQIEDS